MVSTHYLSYPQMQVSTLQPILPLTSLLCPSTTLYATRFTTRFWITLLYPAIVPKRTVTVVQLQCRQCQQHFFLSRNGSNLQLAFMPFVAVAVASDGVLPRINCFFFVMSCKIECKNWYSSLFQSSFVFFYLSIDFPCALGHAVILHTFSIPNFPSPFSSFDKHFNFLFFFFSCFPFCIQSPPSASLALPILTPCLCPH